MNSINVLRYTARSRPAMTKADVISRWESDRWSVERKPDRLLTVVDTLVQIKHPHVHHGLKLGYNNADVVVVVLQHHSGYRPDFTYDELLPD